MTTNGVKRTQTIVLQRFPVFNPSIAETRKTRKSAETTSYESPSNPFQEGLTVGSPDSDGFELTTIIISLAARRPALEIVNRLLIIDDFAYRKIGGRGRPGRPGYIESRHTCPFGIE